MAKLTKSNYPPVAFYFKVTFHLAGETKSETSFKEVSGLSTDISTDEIKEGGELKFRHKLPTITKYNNLILKRGLLNDSALEKWISSGINDFKFTPIKVIVQLLNEEGSPLKTWTCHNAWPVKWEVSNFDSTSNETIIESIELAYDYFES